MRDTVVFDRKKGLLGVKRKSYTKEEKELGTNYVVDILDPINFERIKTVPGHGLSEHNWYPLSNEDPRTQFWRLFNIIDSANWQYSGYSDGDGIQVDEAYIENKHAVFEQIRKIFVA